MAYSPLENALVYDPSAAAHRAELSDLSTAFAEADYQIQLLDLLHHRAERSERWAYWISTVAFLVAIAAGGLSLGAAFKNWQTLATLPWDAIEFLQTLAATIAVLASLILYRSQDARAQRQMLRLEQDRLNRAIEVARTEVKEKTHEITGL